MQFEDPNKYLALKILIFYRATCVGIEIDNKDERETNDQDVIKTDGLDVIKTDGKVQ